MGISSSRMPEGSLRRAYWHSKFSHRALTSYPTVLELSTDIVEE